MSGEPCPTCGHVASPKPLTPREATLLGIIIGKIDDVGYPPSYREMAQAMDLRSIGNIKKLLGGLEYKGWVQVEPNASRAIDVLFRPAALASAPKGHVANPTGGWPARVTSSDPSYVPVAPEPTQITTRRACLSCGHPFDSTGAGNRICGRCKSADEWSSGNDLAVGARG